MLHNFKFTDCKILEIIEEKKLQQIQISQGYANCSIAVIAENAVIVSDIKIAETLRKYKIDVLCLNEIPTIRLLNANNQYSQMNGFIGGALGRVENKIVVFGDLRKIDQQNRIRNFVQKYDLELVHFEDFEMIDYGGIVVI